MDEIFAWLRQWQALVNAGDLDVAGSMFSDDVIAFGSLTSAMTDKDELVQRQWSLVWPRIKDFAFDFETSKIFADPRFQVVTVASLWHSRGLRGDGSWYDRRGRATLVFRGEGERYLCVHSHFSMEPGIPPVDS